MGLGVVLRHLRQPQRLATRRRQRHADQSAGVHRHEVDHGGRDLSFPPDPITLLFAPLVIRPHEEPAPADIPRRPFFFPGPPSCPTYLPRTAPSMCPPSP